MLAIATVVGALAVCEVARQHSRDARTIPLAVRSVMVLAWPLLASRVVPMCNAVVPATVWMLAMWAFEGALVAFHGPTARVQLPAAGLLGMSMAMATLVGNSPRSAFARLFILAYLFCFLVCIPQHDLDRETLLGGVVDAVQHTTLHYCVALVVTATTLTYLQSRDEV